MNHPLLIQIERLYNLIEEKEDEHFALVNSDGSYNTLKSIEAVIEELKRKVHPLEEQFLKESLSKK